MALKTTTWEPDTCGCVLRFEWDDAVPEDERVHTALVHERTCEAHDHHECQHEHFADVLDENQMKNRAHEAARAAHFGSFPIETSFCKDRNLIVSGCESDKQRDHISRALAQHGHVRKLGFE